MGRGRRDALLFAVLFSLLLLLVAGYFSGQEKVDPLAYTRAYVVTVENNTGSDLGPFDVNVSVSSDLFLSAYAVSDSNFGVVPSFAHDGQVYFLVSSQSAGDVNEYYVFYSPVSGGGFDPGSLAGVFAFHRNDVASAVCPSQVSGYSASCIFRYFTVSYPAGFSPQYVAFPVGVEVETSNWSQVPGFLLVDLSTGTASLQVLDTPQDSYFDYMYECVFVSGTPSDYQLECYRDHRYEPSDSHWHYWVLYRVSGSPGVVSQSQFETDSAGDIGMSLPACAGGHRFFALELPSDAYERLYRDQVQFCDPGDDVSAVSFTSDLFLYVTESGDDCAVYSTDGTSCGSSTVLGSKYTYGSACAFFLAGSPEGNVYVCHSSGDFWYGPTPGSVSGPVSGACSGVPGSKDMFVGQYVTSLLGHDVFLAQSRYYYTYRYIGACSSSGCSWRQVPWRCVPAGGTLYCVDPDFVDGGSPVYVFSVDLLYFPDVRVSVRDVYLPTVDQISVSSAVGGVSVSFPEPLFPGSHVVVRAYSGPDLVSESQLTSSGVVSLSPGEYNVTVDYCLGDSCRGESSPVSVVVSAPPSGGGGRAAPAATAPQPEEERAVAVGGGKGFPVSFALVVLAVVVLFVLVLFRRE